MDDYDDTEITFSTFGEAKKHQNKAKVAAAAKKSTSKTTTTKIPKTKKTTTTKTPKSPIYNDDDDDKNYTHQFKPNTNKNSTSNITKTIPIILDDLDDNISTGSEVDDQDKNNSNIKRTTNNFQDFIDGDYDDDEFGGNLFMDNYGGVSTGSDNDVDNRTKKEKDQELKCKLSFQNTIANIFLKETKKANNKNSLTDETLKGLTTITYNIVKNIISKDLFSYAKHAGRKSVSKDDVKLMLRRNPKIYSKIEKIQQNQNVPTKTTTTTTNVNNKTNDDDINTDKTDEDDLDDYSYLNSFTMKKNNNKSKEEDEIDFDMDFNG